MHRVPRQTLFNATVAAASGGVMLNNATTRASDRDVLAAAEIQAIVQSARLRQSGAAAGSAVAARAAMRESSESVFLSGAETFLQPFERDPVAPAATPINGSSTANNSNNLLPSAPAQQTRVMPTQSAATMWGATSRVPTWRAQVPPPPPPPPRDLFEACPSVHGVEISDAIRDVRPAPLIRALAKPRDDDDAGFWSAR